MTRSFRAAAALALLLLAVMPVTASAQVPPDARWRTFETPNFRVNHTPELEPLARRAAQRAERAHAVLSTELVRPPRGKIELIVADPMDAANGAATIFPTNRIYLFAHPPVSEPTLAFYNDWIDLLVIHELVHVFHMDHATGLWSALRRVFGRNPLLFPQIVTPLWVLEGLAVHFESRLTGAGRILGTQHDMVLRTAILEDGFFSIDQATAAPLSWPAGSTPYVYGSLFIDHLARTYGPESLTRFVEAAGGQLIPFAIDRPARRAFGVPFTGAWREWEDSLRVHYTAVAERLREQHVTEPELLTTGGRWALFPRYSPDGSVLAYVAATGVDEPATRFIAADGSVRDVRGRSTLAPISWARDGSRFVHAQHEFADRHRIYSDLYVVSRDGREERLTRGARLVEPDLHPDGRTVVAVRSADGTNELVLRDLGSGDERVLAAASFDVHWTTPRWSPDGSRIAVARWRTGGLFDVLILDPDGRVVREVTSDRAVNADPSWSPDGEFLLFSSDRTGIANLFAHELRTGRLLQITNVLSGAFQPEISPDGDWLAFSFYRADGYYIARIPVRQDEWFDPQPSRPEIATSPVPTPVYAGGVGGPDRRYSPWPSVAPSHWFPLLELEEGPFGSGFGAFSFGWDAVGRHEWNAEAMLHPQARFAGAFDYVYQGFGDPVVAATVRQEWLEVRQAGSEIDDQGTTLPTSIIRRTRSAEAALGWQRPRWRAITWLGLGAKLTDRDAYWDEEERAPETLRLRQLPVEGSARLSGGFSSARGFGLSIGPQQGITASGSLSSHRYLRAFEGEERARGYVRSIARTRGFQPLWLRGFAPDVFALRVDGGIETGSISPGFGVGGASGGAAPFPIGGELVGGEVTFPIRGYTPDAQFGDRALIGSAEYRFPLVLVERGAGTLPIFLTRLWGDVFFDAGSAWCSTDCARRFPGAPTRPDPLYSAGAEITLDLFVGYNAPLPLRGGFAVPLREGGRPQLYLRVGRAF